MKTAHETVHYAMSADTVNETFVRRLCPDEYRAFYDYLTEISCGWAKFVRRWMEVVVDGEEKPQADKANELFDALCDAFSQKTAVSGEGLVLGLVFNAQEDRGDELVGVGWTVENVWDFTPAGRKFQNEILRLTWTMTE